MFTNQLVKKSLQDECKAPNNFNFFEPTFTYHSPYERNSPLHDTFFRLTFTIYTNYVFDYKLP